MRPLPVPPGKSPFRIKGHAYAGNLAYVEEHVPGGLEAVLRLITDRALNDFLRQRFLASSWYDVLPIVALGEAAAEVAGIAPTEQIARSARAQAERDINGIYRMLLRLASPAMIMARLPKVASQYFDFVTAEVVEVAPKKWRSTGHGVLPFAVDAYRSTTEAFLRRALETAGAKNLQHRWLPPVPDGEKHGHAVLAVTREISWD
jgi:hypothetical protein